MNFDHINYHANYCVLENMLVHTTNMLSDCESFADSDDRKKLREAEILIRLVLRDVWDRKHKNLSNLQCKEVKE